VPQVLRTEVNTASCGAEFIYILMNEVGDSIPVASTTATVLLVETRVKSMNSGNDNRLSPTRGWYRILSPEGVPRSVPRSGVPQIPDGRFGSPRGLRSSSLRLSAGG